MPPRLLDLLKAINIIISSSQAGSDRCTAARHDLGLQGGATICMVTHDPRFASYADRQIILFDGQIVDENEAAA